MIIPVKRISSSGSRQADRTRPIFPTTFGKVAPPEQKVPLASYKNRVVSLQWGPKTLNPGETSFLYPESRHGRYRSENRFSRET